MKKRNLVLIALAALLLGVSANRGPVDNGRSITFDVTVTNKDGKPVAGLQKTNFKVFEDNVEQTLTSLRTRTEPLAVVILVEFSDGN